ILEPFDFIEQVVVESSDDRIDRSLQLREINEPSNAGVHRTADGDFASKRMAMHPAALVSLRDIRQIMGSLEAEVFDQLNDVLHFLWIAFCSLVRSNGNRN